MTAQCVWLSRGDYVPSMSDDARGAKIKETVTEFVDNWTEIEVNFKMSVSISLLRIRFWNNKMTR